MYGKIRHPKTMIFFIYVLAIVLVSFNVRADDEVYIDNLHTSEPGVSMIVLEWKDGVIEKLLYKDEDAEKTDRNGKTAYQKWFSERYEQYQNRKNRRRK